MRTKTLLSAVAALAIGISTSLANTYSANIVGYTTTLLYSSLNLVCPTMAASSSNNANQVFPCLVAGDELFLWNTNGSGFSQALYVGPTPPDFGAGEWLDANSFATINAPLLPVGAGLYYNNQSGITETNTFTGTVVLGNTNTVYSSLNLVSSTAPVGGNADTTNFTLPLVAGDELFLWQTNGSGFKQVLYVGPSPPDQGPNEWLDANTFAVIPTPVLTVGAGFYYNNQSGSPEVWKQNVIVPQP